jgi:uncharacterized membrane protein YedE/YeeE
MSFAEVSRAQGQRTLAAGLSGLVFGLGLILAGMTDPARILAFLDIAGDWNPALAFVMAGAIFVAAPAFARARRHPVSLFGGPIRLPERFPIDRRLVGGAIVFGVGWGLTGICPGPGIVLIATGRPEALLFGVGVVLGIAVANRWLGVKAEQAS